MNRKYTIIAIMCSCWLSAAGSSSDPASRSSAAAHQIAAIEAEIAAVEEAGGDRVRRQLEAARAEGLRAEAVKAEVIDRLRGSGNRYEEVVVRIAASGREIGHITINQQGMPTYEGRQIIIFRGSVPLRTENGLKLATLFLPGTTAPIENLREMMRNNGEFITPEVSAVLSGIPRYASVSAKEMFEILLLFKINGFECCQRLVPGYPIDRKGRYDDFTLTGDLVKYLKSKIGVVDTCYIETLIREAAEVAHRNGRSLGIGKSRLESLLTSLSLRFYPVMVSESHSRSIGRCNKEYIERLEEFNPFAHPDDDNFLFVPEPERFVNLIRPTAAPAPVSGQCSIQ